MSEPAPSARRARRPHFAAELRSGERVMPLELFFDLVFVLAFTQCTALMAGVGSWRGLAEGMLVLAVLWWAWVGYAWLTSVVDPEEGAVRIAIFAASAGLLVASLSVPGAFGDRALEFALAYTAVRVAHIVLFVIAGRGDPQLRHSVATLAVSTAIACGLLIGAASAGDGARWALWIIAVVVDFGGPALFGAEGWRLQPGHFAERHNLIIILALGESVVSLGINGDAAPTAEVYAAAVLGIAIAAALWWIYFDVVALITERRLVMAPAGRRRNALARDSYSYLHFPMVAGIVLAAFGFEETLADPTGALSSEAAFALLGGVAIYLLGHVGLRWRNAGTTSWTRLGAAVIFLALWPFTGDVPALALLGFVNVLLWPMIAYETRRYGEGRYLLRHGLDFEPPTRGSAGEEELEST
jgi:low temperature requirement protein LtrA